MNEPDSSSPPRISEHRFPEPSKPPPGFEPISSPSALKVSLTTFFDPCSFADAEFLMGLAHRQMARDLGSRLLDAYLAAVSPAESMRLRSSPICLTHQGIKSRFDHVVAYLCLDAAGSGYLKLYTVFYRKNRIVATAIQGVRLLEGA